MRARDRLALLMSISLIVLIFFLIGVIGVLAILDKEPSLVLANLTFSVFGAFVGYVSAVATSYFNSSR